MTRFKLKDNSELLTFRYIDMLAPNVQVLYLPSGNPYLVTLPQPADTVPVVPTTTPPISDTVPVSPTTTTP